MAGKSAQQKRRGTHGTIGNCFEVNFLTRFMKGARLMSKEKEVIETSEAQIAVHWQEEEYFYPSTKFIGQANLTDPAVFDRFSLDNFPDCFIEFAEMLTWYKQWDQVLDTSDAPCWKWFKGGLINVSYNCIDRHLAKKQK
jgi:acetyl-CoA synthetase